MASSRKNLIEIYSLILYHYKEINIDKLRHLNHVELMILIKPLGKRLCESLGVKYENGNNEEEIDDDYPTEFSSKDFNNAKLFEGTKEGAVEFFSQFTDVYVD